MQEAENLKRSITEEWIRKMIKQLPFIKVLGLDFIDKF